MKIIKNFLGIGAEKTPGFGIAQQYYLTVLAAKVPLPSLRLVVRPDGADGAVAGLGVPLAPDTKKEDLDKPLVRGSYALAMKDKRTILTLIALSKEEARFDPLVFVKSEEAAQFSEELRQRASATWMLLQLRFQSHTPSVYPALDFLLKVATRLATLTDGVIADPISELYLLPEELARPRPAGIPIAARDFVRIRYSRQKQGSRIFTLGLQKFALPELELTGIEDSSLQYAGEFLIGVAQGVLMGKPLTPGDRVGDPACPLIVATGGLGAMVVEGIPILELIPERGDTVEAAIRGWMTNLGAGKNNSL